MLEFELRSGNTITHPGAVDTLSTDAACLDQEMYLHPVYVPVQPRTFDRITIRIDTAGGAGAKSRLGIYRDVNGSPGALELDAGTVDTDSTGTKAITISKTLNPGWWWLAHLLELGAAADPAFVSSSTFIPLFGWDSAYANRNDSIAATNVAAGSLPDPCPSPRFTAQLVPLVFLRLA